MMKIVSWNCNGKFREILNLVLKYGADIYVIQESENPLKYKEKFKILGDRFLWTGLSENKGLLIFWNENIKVVDNNWQKYCLRHFLSVKIYDTFDLVGVWTGKHYIEEYYIYHSIQKDKYNENTVIIGDFNSNAIWNKKHGERGFNAVVSQLAEKGLYSAYHYVLREEYGSETEPTFFLYRKKEKPYHIDYCFLNCERVNNFGIGLKEDWLQYSDHMPLFVIFDEKRG